MVYDVRKMKQMWKKLMESGKIFKISNIFAFHYKLQEKLKELIQLIASIYKYKVNNIILTQQYLMYAP